MRNKVIRIFWSDPITIHEAIASQASSGDGLYYITVFMVIKKRVYI